jgi:hypothetical protein
VTVTDWLLVAVALLLLGQILQGRQIVAAIDDLTTAVTNLEASSTAVVNKINQLKASGVDPVAVEALVARVNTVSTNLTAAAQ